MLVILPSTILKPAGVFIHALAVTTKMPDVTPPRITSTPQNQCTRGGKRFHPIKYKPRKIASVKNAKPSSENGIRMIAPDFSMKPGHSRPSTKEISHWNLRIRLNVAVRVTRDQRHFADQSRYCSALLEKCALEAGINIE